MAPRKQNFFIVGAPKCGTTALYHALFQHPDVFLPSSEDTELYWLHKEPLYFSDDLGISHWLRLQTEEEYLGLFAGAGGARRVGEVSALYLHSHNAPQRIREFADDDCRIIITLRPPVEWMRSWHHDCLRYGHETIGNFREALAAEPDREAGRRIPRRSGFKGCLCYRRGARFSELVERYFEIFGRERVKVILMEDLNREPLRTLQEIAEFLNISSEISFTIDRRNDSQLLTYTHLLEFRIGRKIAGIPRLKYFVDLLPSAPLNYYRRAILRLLPPLSDKKIEPELQSQLIDEFRSEVDRLSALLERDLTHWNNSPKRFP